MRLVYKWLLIVVTSCKNCVKVFSLVSPERIEDKSGEKKADAENHKQAVTQPLVLGIVGQLGSLKE